MIRRSGSPRLIAGLLIASLPIASLPIAPAAGAPAGSSAFAALVTTTSGRFEGFLIETMGTIAWLGMPYATPPVGGLLFVTSVVARVPLTKMVSELWPFMWAQIAVLGMLTLVPGISTLLPGLFGYR